MNQFEFISQINIFKDKLFRLAKRLLVSTEEAEDAVQEIILKLWNQNDNFKKIDNLEAMVMTMTKNYCLDQLKSKRAQNLHIVNDEFDNKNVSYQQNLEDKDSLTWVDKIINNLPEQQKLIVQMREIEQYEFEEIGKILDMEQTAIRVALSRARKTIKENMSKTHSYGIE